MGHSLSFDDVYVLAVNCKPGSPLAVALNPQASWTALDYWLCSIEYSLRWLVWSKTKDGEKGRKRPKPIKPPQAENKSKKTFVGMDKKALKAFLSAPRMPMPGGQPVIHSLPDDTESQTNKD